MWANLPKKFKAVKFGNNVLIGKSVKIGKNSHVGSNTIIESNVSIGDDVIIGNNVIIKNSIIGDRVVLQDNVKIGQKGFGFIPLPKKYQISTYWESYYWRWCWNWFGCTIDRGSIDNTVIGKNTYLDESGSYSSYVKIGSNCMIAGQVGFAGSTHNNNVSIGGQAGFLGHLKIGNNVKIGGGSGVKNINDNQIVMGYPAIPLKDFLKNQKK